VGILLVLEVQSFGSLLDTNGLLVSLVLQNQLLEEQKGALMAYTLADLNLRGPRVWCPCLFAVVALLVCDHKLHLERLLQHSVVLDFLLHDQLHLDASGVGLCPQKLRI